MDRNTPNSQSDRKSAPNPWVSVVISVIALLLSCASLYLVQFNKGSLKILFPDKLAIGLDSSGNFSIVLPLTFTNTGASRQGKEVLKVWVDLSSTSVPGYSLTADWRYEVAFMHRLDYYKKYPDEKKRDKGEEDIIVYSTRAFPFHLEGGKSTSKSYYLLQSKGTLPTKDLGTLVLTLHVKTDNGDTKNTIRYELGNEPVSQSLAYATRIDEHY